MRMSDGATIGPGQREAEWQVEYPHVAGFYWLHWGHGYELVYVLKVQPLTIKRIGVATLCNIEERDGLRWSGPLISPSPESEQAPHITAI